jgi:hydroxyacylglutathione hydrolase
MQMEITLIPAFSDNYIYLLSNGEQAAVVDPGEAAPVLAFIEENNLTLTHLLCTHHHGDHIGGVDRLKQETGCLVLGPKDLRIPQTDQCLEEGEHFSDQLLEFDVLSVPGHTSIHLAYHFPKEHWLFTGDSLFVGGCGRLFEGTAAQMWHSLSKFLRLPDTTEVYCGHEYTLSNLQFAQSLEPNHPAIATKLSQVEEKRRQGLPTIPSTLGEEKETNPFLRVQDPSLAKAVDMEGSTPEELFAEIRKRKDLF